MIFGIGQDTGKIRGQGFCFVKDRQNDQTGPRAGRERCGRWIGFQREGEMPAMRKEFLQDKEVRLGTGIWLEGIFYRQGESGRGDFAPL